VESLNARFRDEVLDVEEFATLAEPRFLATNRQAGYSHEHPTPRLARCRRSNEQISQRELSQAVDR